MGYFSELAYDIVELVESGMPLEDVATKCGVSIEDVEEVIETFSGFELEQEDK
jgi:hypothetical protein